MADVLLGQGYEFTVNTTFGAGQAVPAAKLLQNGNIIVTWNDEPGSAVRAQIITADGTKVGTEFQINQNDPGSQSQSNLQNSNVTVLTDGKFVVTWTDSSKVPDSGDSSGSAIKYRVFNQDGTPATDELLANTRTLDSQSAPTITALSGGSFAIVWQDANKTLPADTDAAGSAIRAQLFTGDGTKSGSEFLVNTTVAGNQTTPFITTLADGTFVVTWIDAAGSGDILGQRYSAAGVAIGTQFTIDADAAADTIPVVTALRDTSAAVGNGNNNFVVSWVSTTAGNADIHAKIFTYDTAAGALGGPLGDGFTAGSELTINSLNALAGNQNSPTLLARDNGGFIAGFRDQNFATSSSTAAAMIREYDKTGAPVNYVSATGVVTNVERMIQEELTGQGNFGYKTVFPSMVLLPNGSVLAFFEERLGHGLDNDDESVRGVVLKSYVLTSGTSGNGAESLSGTAGKDTLLLGLDGNDALAGNTGNDVLVGGAGGDKLDGGAGIDTASYLDAAAGVVADLKYGANTGAVTGFAAAGDAVGDQFVRIENLTGSRFADRLYGDDANNELQGADGDDVLTGRGGADILKGGSGTDTADYSAATAGVVVDLVNGGSDGDATGDKFHSIENVTGTAFADYIIGNSDSNVIKGLGGNDVLAGGTDVVTDQLFDGDVFDGGDGIDTVSYDASESGVVADLVTGGGTALDGSAGDAQGDTYISIENLVGSAHDDILGGNAGVNILYSQDGDDTLEGRGGADKLLGGEGSDTASYEHAAAAVKASLAAPASNTGDAKGDVYSSIENLKGSAFADTLTGNAENNIIEGGKGADTIDGGAGIDTASYANSAAAVTIGLSGLAGSGGDAQGDRLTSIEYLIGSGFGDTLTGNASNNWFEGGAGADTINGGAGSDTAVYSGSSAGVTVDLTLAVQNSTGDANGDKLTGIENVYGSQHDDVLLGNAASNTLRGQDGDDVLEGRGGADRLLGGDGSDTASYEHSAAGVTASLEDAAGNTGDAAGDTYDSIENLRGSAKADTLTGDDDDNVIEGGAGADTLDGGLNEDGGDTVSYAHDTVGVTVDLSLATAQSGGDAQGDILSGFENVEGGSGADTLTGDSGNNLITGGLGADTLAGGGGQDGFVYRLAAEGGDTINNFIVTDDSIVLDFSATAFNFVNTMPDIVLGTAAVTTAASFIYNSTTGSFSYDADGTGAGAAVVLAHIYSDVATTAASLTMENIRIVGIAGLLSDDD